LFEATRQGRCRNKGEPKDVLLDFFIGVYCFGEKQPLGYHDLAELAET